MLLAGTLRSERQLLLSGRWLLFAVVLLASVIVLCDAQKFIPSKKDINVGAFNIKQFGPKKCRNKEVMEEIAKIVSQFDIIAIQEIRDAGGQTVARCLLNNLRRCECQQKKGCQFGYEISKPLGDTRYKERYAFFYRQDILRVIDSHQSQVQGFKRPPFAVHVSLKISDSHVPEFLFIVAHIQPKQAAEEINLLSEVYRDFQQTTGVSNAIIGGDLNAGGSYWKDSYNVNLTSERGFYWLINSNTRTNVRGKAFAYDRFIVKGDELRKYVRGGTAGIYKITQENTEVSDHYPIGMHLLVGTERQKGSLVCKSRVQNPLHKQARVCRGKAPNGKRNIFKP